VTAPRPPLPRALLAGGLLVLVGFASWILYAVQSRGEAHSYAPGKAPPTSVRLERGHTYWLSIPDGVRGVTAAGFDPTHLRCTAARVGQAPVALSVSGESRDTKLTTRIASFIAQSTESVHIECTGIGAVYVDNATDAKYDWSGLALVLASLALAVGLPLTLSGLRSLPRPPRQEPTEPEPTGPEPTEPPAESALA
jgi:hypothetical protein